MCASSSAWTLRFHPLPAPRVLLMVSQHGHCLNDLLFRWQSGQLPVDIPAIVSNHERYAALAKLRHPFPSPAAGARGAAEAKRAQEQRC
jgi:formyltetrahydrofolate deformylase